MRCPACGKELGSTVFFCTSCGVRLDEIPRLPARPPAASSTTDEKPREEEAAPGSGQSNHRSIRPFVKLIGFLTSPTAFKSGKKEPVDGLRLRSIARVPVWARIPLLCAIIVILWLGYRWSGNGINAAPKSVMYRGDNGHTGLYRTGRRNTLSQKIWSFKSPDWSISQPVFYKKRIYITTKKKIYALDARDGKKRFELQANEPKINGLIIVDDILYYYGRQVIAVRASNGDSVWVSRVIGTVVVPPLYLNGNLYLVDVQGDLTALDANDGRVLWRFDGNYPDINGSPAGTGDDVFISDKSGMYSLYAKTGVTRWVFKAEENQLSSPVLYKRAVYCGSLNRTLYAIDASTGKLIWQREEIANSNAPAVADDKVFAAGKKHVRALNARTGNELWRFGGPDMSFRTTFTDGRNIYATSSGEMLYMLDMATGYEKGRYYIKYPIEGEPLPVGRLIFVANKFGELIALK